jgi:hypothetical protein
MAASFDFSGLPMLEASISALQSAQAATPSIFTGGATFTATYQSGSPGSRVAATTETVASISARVAAMKLLLDQLPR